MDKANLKGLSKGVTKITKLPLLPLLSPAVHKKVLSVKPEFFKFV